mgnify:CR=1 FL=1
MLLPVLLIYGLLGASFFPASCHVVHMLQGSQKVVAQGKGIAR